MNPPKSGKRYQEILELGCGGKHDYWGDFDCEHGYEWTCDNCPIVIELQKQREKKALIEALCSEEMTYWIPWRRKT